VGLRWFEPALHLDSAVYISYARAVELAEISCSGYRCYMEVGC